MMNKICCGVFLLAGLPGLAAADSESTQLRVTGVVKPDACVPDFSTGGVINYGIVPTSDLQPGEVTVLTKRTVSLSVNCALSTRVAIKLVDNRVSTIAPQLLATTLTPNDEAYNFGLGAAAGKNTGGYVVSFENVETTQKAGSQILEATGSNDSAHWEVMSGNLVRKDTLYSFDQAANGVLDSLGGASSFSGGIRHFQTTFGVQAIIDNREHRSVKEKIPFDGSATFEMFYP